MPIPISPGDLAAEPGVERSPLGEPGASGASLERLRLPDGRTLVRKAFDAGADWMMRATRDPGRAATLWVSGAMDALPPVIDPAIVRIERGPADREAAWVLYLEDVSASFLRRGTIVDASECRRILEALAAMHAAYWSRDAATRPHPGLADLTSLADLLRLASPETVAREASSEHPFIGVLRAGWAAFDELADELGLGDVSAAIRGILLDPEPLARALVADGATLIHSDPHYGNIAPALDRFYVLDWGLAAWGPPAVDFAWWLDQSLAFLGPRRDELIDAFRVAEAPRHRESSLDLALLAELALAGWQYLAALRAPDAGVRERRRSDFRWWCAHARRGLDRLG